MVDGGRRLEGFGFEIFALPLAAPHYAEWASLAFAFVRCGAAVGRHDSLKGVSLFGVLGIWQPTSGRTLVTRVLQQQHHHPRQQFEQEIDCAIGRSNDHVCQLGFLFSKNEFMPSRASSERACSAMTRPVHDTASS